ncbi:hypothetical protein CPB83DRAFT_859281 [Crepidotus variabilis]|uniref:FAD-binding PCMH-type domain-containing protein n=1 Tax=Crepidotus variabilis TaxID=179855 RepID=A0A9P6JM82_9AGAR|nr:hypothetical protein CPB83DRAFT_859281 [Crepidotus variabilis]
MPFLRKIVVAVVASLLSGISGSLAADGIPSSAIAACTKLSQDPNFAHAFTGSPQYDHDISHWSNASSLPSLCTMEPSSPQQVQKLFSIINDTRSPWAVKGLGHCNNNNMSATYGLQIDMSRFSQISLSQDKQSVKVGMGVAWGQVYQVLGPHNLTAVGGRSPTVGVAGLSLSSGYSWVTNEYGFAIDNTLAADIVLPNGTFTTVSESHGGDIFRALQGGLNNFGIVTSITLKTHPIGQVWGGSLTISGDLKALVDATVEYSAKPSNPKATLAVEFLAKNGTATGLIIMFYDGAHPPPGLFDAFVKLPNSTGEVKTQSFFEFVQAGEVAASPTNRATWYSAPVLKWTRDMVEYVHQQVIEYSVKLAKQSKSGTLVSGNIEPFGPQAYGFSRGSAWPHDVDHPYNTFNGLMMWSDPSDDKALFPLNVEYHTKVWNKAISLGLSKPKGQVFFPPNYSQNITPVEQIYGANLGWLRKLKQQVDPWGLISLTGGFKI